jgi:hypothetical protein
VLADDRAEAVELQLINPARAVERRSSDARHHEIAGAEADLGYGFFTGPRKLFDWRGSGWRTSSEPSTFCASYPASNVPSPARPCCALGEALAQFVEVHVVESANQSIISMLHFALQREQEVIHVLAITTQPCDARQRRG